MSAQLRAELLKLRTVRATALVLVACVVLGPLLAFLEALTSEQTTAADSRSVLTNAGISGLLILLYGVVSMTGEERHDTIAGTLVAVRDRRRVVVAKALAMALCGLLAGALSAIAVAAVALPLLGDAPLEDAGGLVLAFAGQLAYSALAGVIGVGLGALGRSQALTLVAVLVWLLAIEPTLGQFFDLVNRFGIEGSAAALARAPQLGDLPQGAALAVYAGWALVALAAGSAVLRRRDVT
jgi:ABC-2 type transport system permease protein